MLSFVRLDGDDERFVTVCDFVTCVAVTLTFVWTLTIGRLA